MEFNDESFEWLGSAGGTSQLSNNFEEMFLDDDLNAENIPVHIADPPVILVNPSYAVRFGLHNPSYVAFANSVSVQTKERYFLWNDGLVSFASTYEPPDDTAEAKALRLLTDTSVILMDAVLPYLQMLWALKNSNGSKTYCANSMKSFLSAFIKLFQYAHRIDLLERCPIIVAVLRGWLTNHETKKAKTFTKEQLVPWLASVHTPESLIRKVYCIIGLGFAARGGEEQALPFSAVQCISSVLTRVTYRRLKQRGVSGGASCAHIIGVMENKVIQEYISCFTPEQQKGKLFKKLVWYTPPNGAPQIIRGTNIVVGKNKMADYCKDIARDIGLPNANSYTGHTLRRSAITWAANAGLPLAQIKCLSGHRSDTVVQGYIDTSDHMRNITAGAVSVEAPSTAIGVAGGGRTITLNITL